MVDDSSFPGRRGKEQQDPDDSGEAEVGGPSGVLRDEDRDGFELASRIASAASGGPAPMRRRRRPQGSAAWSGAGPSARDPQSAGSLLDRVMKARGWTKTVSVASLTDRWSDFVGETNAAHTKPERFSDGQLTVRAESTTWATALRTMAPIIVARLNETLGQGTVTRIHIIGPTAPSWKKGRLSVPGRGPRDTYG
jgi:predicted nucleic acid-binding Zn ribbon protein